MSKRKFLGMSLQAHIILLTRKLYKNEIDLILFNNTGPFITAYVDNYIHSTRIISYHRHEIKWLRFDINVRRLFLLQSGS